VADRSLCVMMDAQHLGLHHQQADNGQQSANKEPFGEHAAQKRRLRLRHRRRRQRHDAVERIARCFVPKAQFGLIGDIAIGWYLGFQRLVEISHTTPFARSRPVERQHRLVATTAHFYDLGSRRVSARRCLAAARNAVVVRRTLRVARFPTGHRISSAAPRARRRAIRVRGCPANADLTWIARVEARFDRRTRVAGFGIVLVRPIARAGALLGRAEPDVVATVGRKLTAAEAITPVGRERQAIVETLRCLRCREGRTGQAATGDRQIRVIAAVRVSARRVVWSNGKRIAVLTPITMIVARARVLIEVAILPTRSVILTGNPSEVGVFGIVARAGAIRICRIVEAVAVVVEAVSALIDEALAGS